MSVERFLKSVHSWLGAMILPWVVAAGVTGFYMNHRDLVLSVLPEPVGAEVFESSPMAREVGAAEAERIAEKMAPDETLLPDGSAQFHGRAVFAFDGDAVRVYVDRATGFGWVRGRYVTRVAAPDGAVLAREVRWSRVLSSIHQRGWVGSALGTWLADILAGALVVFGLSGLVLFAAPRLRRARNRRARVAQARRA